MSLEPDDAVPDPGRSATIGRPPRHARAVVARNLDTNMARQTA
jgi:hypothetical protein